MKKQPPLVGVGTLIIKNKQIYLIKRKHIIGENQWATPGGHVEYGEMVSDASIRECYEEVDIEITDQTFLCYTDDFFMEHDAHYVTFWFLCKSYKGHVKEKAKDEIVVGKWFDIDNLPDNLFTPFMNMLIKTGTLYEAIKTTD